MSKTSINGETTSTNGLGLFSLLLETTNVILSQVSLSYEREKVYTSERTTTSPKGIVGDFANTRVFVVEMSFVFEREVSELSVERPLSPLFCLGQFTSVTLKGVGFNLFISQPSVQKSSI